MNISLRTSATLFSTFVLLGLATSAAAVTIYAVDASNNLLKFNSASPGTILATIPITGLQTGETIEGVDFRTNNSSLYALGKTGSAGRLYIVNTTTGAAFLVSSSGTFTLTGTIFGFDFDPVANRFRVVSNAEQNIVIDPATGTLEATDAALAYAAGDPNNGANPTIVAAAYSNSVLGASSTTLYDLDAGLDILVTQDPPASGQLTTKGSLGLNTASVAGFDIASASGGNIGYATLRVNNVVGLYTISLTGGTATLVGAVGGNPNLVDMTVSLEVQTFVVTNTHDLTSGVCDSSNCYLRDAINASNAKPGRDLITFNIPGSGVKTFTPLSALPVIFDPVTIDGYSQPGASENTLASGNNAVLLIELNGASAGNVSGLTIRASGCQVLGLVINRFPAAGVTIGPPTGTDGARSNQIMGNFIGTDPGGTIDLGNGAGISISGPGSIIGGLFPQRRNLISGNTNGVHVTSVMTNNVLVSYDNQIIGNYIGTDKNGTAALGNSSHGVFVLSHDNQIGRTDPGGGNLVSGNLGSGIEIQGAGAANNVVLGNLIGTDASGNAALGNANNGVLINAAPNNTVGGAAPGARNVISANGQGVWMIFGATNNRVLGNYIGTNAAGQTDLGNGTGVTSSAPANFIGGSAPGEGNLISGNSNGVAMNDTTAAGNVVQGNRIGTSATGGALGNSLGVFLTNGSSNTTVGGAGAAGNIIAFNNLYGVYVDISTGNQIFGNSIFTNSGLGINLNGGTEDARQVTANDSLDPDSGANNLQNYPVLTGITGSGSSRVMTGQLNSSPNTAFVIDYYRNSAVDQSGFGEGQNPMGSFNVQTDGQGNATFSFPLDSSADGQFITTTATDPNGNTSEFSMASSVVPGPTPTPTPVPTATATPTATASATITPPSTATPTATPDLSPTPTPSASPNSHLANISTRLRVEAGDNVLIAGFIVQGNGDKSIIIRGIGPSLGTFGVADPLQDPTLELYADGVGLIATNNNWADNPNAGEIVTTGLAPINPNESALLLSVAPGSYTAVLRGTGGSTGIGLVELYDLNAGGAASVANISTRGFIFTGENVMIAGLIITGNDPAQLVLRGIGPSLSNFGVPNVLADPLLELRNSDGALLQANNDWDAQDVALQATGLAPTNHLESAILISVPPGSYTAILKGADGGIGNGLVEIYKIAP